MRRAIKPTGPKDSTLARININELPQIAARKISKSTVTFVIMKYPAHYKIYVGMFKKEKEAKCSLTIKI
ncbi:hypothetical protein GCM10009133_06980 [Cocleimonas flava]